MRRQRVAKGTNRRREVIEILVQQLRRAIFYRTDETHLAAGALDRVHLGLNCAGQVPVGIFVFLAAAVNVRVYAFNGRHRVGIRDEHHVIDAGQCGQAA